MQARAAGSGFCQFWCRRWPLLGGRSRTEMPRIEALLTSNRCALDTGVIVGHGHAGFLPARPVHELIESAAAPRAAMPQRRTAPAARARLPIRLQDSFVVRAMQSPRQSVPYQSVPRYPVSAAVTCLRPPPAR